MPHTHIKPMFIMSPWGVNYMLALAVLAYLYFAQIFVDKEPIPMWDFTASSVDFF